MELLTTTIDSEVEERDWMKGVRELQKSAEEYIFSGWVVSRLIFILGPGKVSVLCHGFNPPAALVEVTLCSPVPCGPSISEFNS